MKKKKNYMRSCVQPAFGYLGMVIRDDEVYEERAVFRYSSLDARLITGTDYRRREYKKWKTVL